MQKLFAVIALAVAASQAGAADLFVDGKLRPIAVGDPIVATDTIGGYPIYQDDGRWKFVSGRESSSTGRADPIRMGNVLLDYSQDNYLLARQSLTATVDEGGTNSSWTGSPCAVGHLVIRNKGRGRQDNCMTIDPAIINRGTVPVLFFKILLTNSGSSGRYYQMALYVNADLLGVRNTGLGDWTPELVATTPYKQAALDRLTRWAEPLQDGSILALDFSKPKDVYAKVPSLMTLLPIPDDLVGKKRSISFLSAVEHVRYQPAFSSIAFSHWGDYKSMWNSVTGQTTQAVADAAALAKCENSRKISRPDAPACAVYRIPDVKSASRTE